jgi:hypothetical protein
MTDAYPETVGTISPGPFYDWCDRGFFPDIIPIIPPGVRAKLHDGITVGDGKTPGSRVGFEKPPREGECDPGEIERIKALPPRVKYAARTYYGMSGWRTADITPYHIGAWDEVGLPSNIGLRTARFPALDIDIKEPEDAALVQAIQRLVREECPEEQQPWVRYRDNSPSSAILFNIDGTPFGKGSRNFITPSGHEAKIELLADGQQIVVGGMHASGFPLRWRRLNETTDSLPRMPEMPALSGVEGANTLLDRIYEFVIERGCAPSQKVKSAACGAATRTTPAWAVQPEDDPFYQRLLKEHHCEPAKEAHDGRWKAQMSCPWESEHGERPDTGTVYFVGGGFVCSHNACALRKWPELQQHLRDELGWPVERMLTALWNARQRSVQQHGDDTLRRLAAARRSA